MEEDGAVERDYYGAASGYDEDTAMNTPRTGDATPMRSSNGEDIRIHGGTNGGISGYEIEDDEDDGDTATPGSALDEAEEEERRRRLQEEEILREKEERERRRLKKYRLRMTLKGHRRAVAGVKISPDGETVASCCTYSAWPSSARLTGP